MLPGQKLPWQMSPLQLESVQDGPRNLLLKFGQNRVSNSWYIPDMDKCCLDKSSHDSWNHFKMVPEIISPNNSSKVHRILCIYLETTKDSNFSQKMQKIHWFWFSPSEWFLVITQVESPSLGLLGLGPRAQTQQAQILGRHVVTIPCLRAPRRG